MRVLPCTRLTGPFLALWTSAVVAQPVNQLQLANGSFRLSLPYFEYASGNSRQAFSAVMNAPPTLNSFTLDAASVKSTALLASTPQAASLAAVSGGYRLSLPYLEYSDGGPLKAFRASLSTVDLKTFVLESGSVVEIALLNTPLAGPTALALTAPERRTVGTASFGSSSKLLLNWVAPAGFSVDHYEITAIEALKNTSLTIRAAGTQTSATLSPLKAATTYSVTVKACAESTCTRYGGSSTVSAATAAEYWQLQGSGNSVVGLSQPVADGNARLSATRFGAEAGAAANTVQLYYGPKGITGQAVAGSGPVSALNPASYLGGFTSFASTSGLRSPGVSAGSGIKDIMTGQGVPLSAAMGAKVRLFFESNDVDGKTRIYSVDSVDGYLGRDFNRSAASTCSNSADYAVGGNCMASVVLGVGGDAVNPVVGVNAVRQNKIAWPTLTDWRWDGAIGTPMVFTIDRINGCTTATHNQGYALWNGTRFVPQFDTNGCLKAFKSAQAALPMHIGGVRYKLYFGDPSLTTGQLTGGTLPFVGPKKMIYADGASTGEPGIVEFEDWEDVAVARRLVFLWPSGEPLSDGDAGYIDDFQFLTPTGSLDIQVLYLSMTDGFVLPFAAVAVLLNP